MLFYDSKYDSIEAWPITSDAFSNLCAGTSMQFRCKVRNYWVYDISCFWGKLLLELEHAVL